MKKQTKKQRVERYLNRLMKGRYFKIDDLMALTASRLKENTAIMDISLSTINEVLSVYKSRFNAKDEALKKITNDPTTETKESLASYEIEQLRNIIQWFKNNVTDNGDRYEELVMALKDSGIDHIRILERYRKGAV